MKGTEKRVQPPRHKPTIDKYFNRQGKLERQVKRSHNPAQSKGVEPIESDRHVKQRKKSEEDSFEATDNVRIRALQEFFDGDAHSHLINISRTSKGLAITRPGRSQTRATIESITSLNNQAGQQSRSKVEVLDNVNSLLMGPDDRLYNMLTQEGFRDLMKAEQMMQQRAKQKPISCNCKKTHCLKMYCECISKNMYCNSDCQCKDCYNNSVHEIQRQKSKEKTTTRKGPMGKQNFLDNDDYPAQKSCNCKKSGCNKKYCECYGAGIKCSAACKCSSCKNRGDDQQKRPQVAEEESRPMTFAMMHYDGGDNMYGGNISNGFHLSQLEYDSMRNRSVFGPTQTEPQTSKIFSFAGVNQSQSNLLGTLSKTPESKR